MASRLNPTNFGYQNFYSALLTADITSGSLTISLDTVPTPTSGILVIDPDSATSREVILYTSKGASTITLPSDGRGYSGSTPAAHLTGTTVIMAPIDKWFSALASGELSTDPLRTELFYDYVASGLVWSADAAGSTLNGSMTSGVIYINGRRLTLAAVTAHAFTLNKDTYIDVSDNGDGTGLITYNETTNNAASPALTTNNVRIGVVQTGATNIASAGAVNQGEESKVLPIASSIPYQVTDSLGNLICNRNPFRLLLGLRRRLSTFSTASTSFVDITELNIPFIVPGSVPRKVKFTVSAGAINITGAGAIWNIALLLDGTVIQQWYRNQDVSSLNMPVELSFPKTITSGSHTAKLQISASANTVNMSAGADNPGTGAFTAGPMSLRAELS